MLGHGVTELSQVRISEPGSSIAPTSLTVNWFANRLLPRREIRKFAPAGQPGFGRNC